MPRKREISPDEPTGTEILEGIRMRYGDDDLPSLVWRVLEADASAEIIESESKFYDDPRSDDDVPF